MMLIFKGLTKKKKKKRRSLAGEICVVAEVGNLKDVTDSRLDAAESL
jgi:hypothetical protein